MHEKAGAVLMRVPTPGSPVHGARFVNKERLSSPAKDAWRGARTLSRSLARALNFAAPCRRGATLSRLPAGALVLHCAANKFSPCPEASP